METFFVNQLWFVGNEFISRSNLPQYTDEMQSLKNFSFWPENRDQEYKTQSSTLPVWPELIRILQGNRCLICRRIFHICGWMNTVIELYQTGNIWREKKEIISRRCMEAVRETMELIKDNLELEGLFISSGNIRTRRKIQNYISRGDLYTLRTWGFGFVIECAAALKLFLQTLPQPLIPARVQKLVIAENRGVPERTIANDALGLLKEEVSGRHRDLLLEVFTFLKDAAVRTYTSELTGCSLPLKLLPVFFELEADDPQKFRDVASVFHEIIMEAPEHLRPRSEEIGSDEFKLLEKIITQDLRMPSFPFFGGLRNNRNQLTEENPEWRIPLPRVPHTRLHPWLGRQE